MLIEISGGKGIDIKLGSRVILEDVKFQETDRNAAAGPVVYKRIIVESVDANLKTKKQTHEKKR